MSFAKDAKNQVLNKPINNKCCGISFLSGLLHVSSEYDKFNNKLILVTDIPSLKNFCNDILKMIYSASIEFVLDSEFKINKVVYFKYVLKTNNLEQILNDFCLFNNNNFSIDFIDKEKLKNQCCLKSFIKGVFVGCATSGIRLSEKKPEKTSSGYDIEFIASSYTFLDKFSQLLESFNIFPKIIQRKKNYVLYIKERNAVCDLLAIVEAFNSVLQLQNELAIRELRNKVNRQTNCLNANISKIVDASLKQLTAIKYISDTVGLEYLSADLQEVALLRLANPEESLRELLKLATFETSKSSLNHRLNKIIKIANNLKSYKS